MTKVENTPRNRHEGQIIALRLPKVLEYTGLSRTQVYRLISIGKFPAPRKLSAGISAWNQKDIESWLQDKFLTPHSLDSKKGAANVD